jgi:hypothetical protein
MRKLLLCVMFVSVIAAAQTPRVEAFGGYSLLHTPGQSFNGWNGAATVNVYRCIGITADLSGHYWTRSFTVPTFGTIKASTHIFSYTFGPTISLRNRSRFTPFSRFLLGASRYSFPGASSSPMHQFTIVTGGGLDIAVSQHLALRPVQLDYHTVDFSGIWENGLRYSAGVVFRFGEK